MATVDEQGRTEPPIDADEVATLVGFLDFQRATTEWKCAGVDAAGMAATLPPGSMTLGGLLKHLSYVEDWWFGQVLRGLPPAPPWREADWEADPDWDWHSAGDDTPEDLLALWRERVENSRRAVADALAEGGLGQRVRRELTSAAGTVERMTLRWVLVHMIEEYARHNGHADLLREAYDGATGE